ncbi:DEAD/DEAH box helicase [Azospirillum sp. ST 5-10]|uniref:DEAD/DEAH box helicase n=1 Tax=unclassified Azospirillum TaxID=2630922 RepID=UPI003F49E7DD
MTEFATLGLSDPLLNAVAEEGYTTATPIQAQAIPLLLEGRDVLGLAQTGTGKTAAFALPILDRLMAERKRTARGTTRALVLVPTRELAVQVSDGFGTYGRHLPLRRTVIFGGVGQTPQVAAVARGVDILVATPGRLLDLMAQGHIRLDTVEVLVLDEADRMLDMGFAPAIRKIVAQVPAERHTLLFSATMPDEVAGLARSLLKPDHARIEVAPPATTAERIEQRVLFVDRADKRPLLVELLSDPTVERAIVFARTKHGADRVAEHLRKAGLGAEAIHGNKSQSARQRALLEFREGRVRALVATDIAARGIDVDGITHVINFDLPNEPESYVHRIGRTARAGAAGIALSMCDADEVANLRAIEKTIRRAVPVHTEHGFHDDAVAHLHRLASQAGNAPPRKKPQSQGGRPQPQAQHRRQPRSGHGRPTRRPEMAG